MLFLYVQYFANGVMSDFSDVARSYFLVDECALTIEDITGIDYLLMLPWLLNLAFVFGSDYTQNRRSWILLALAMGCAAWAMILLTQCHSPRLAVFLLFCAEAGVACWSVVLDATLMGTSEVRAIQYRCMSCALVGKTSGAVLGGMWRHLTHNKAVFIAQMTMFACMLFALSNVSFPAVHSITEPLKQPVMTRPGHRPAVHRTVVFWFLLCFSMIPSARIAILYFLIGARDFTPTEVGMLDSVANLFAAATFFAYDRFLQPMPHAQLFTLVCALNLLSLLLLLAFVQRFTVEAGVSDLMGAMALPSLAVAASLAYAPFQAIVVDAIRADENGRKYQGSWFALLSTLPFLGKIPSSALSLKLTDQYAITRVNFEGVHLMLHDMLWCSLFPCAFILVLAWPGTCVSRHVPSYNHYRHTSSEIPT